MCFLGCKREARCLSPSAFTCSDVSDELERPPIAVVGTGGLVRPIEVLLHLKSEGDLALVVLVVILVISGDEVSEYVLGTGLGRG